MTTPPGITGLMKDVPESKWGLHKIVVERDRRHRFGMDLESCGMAIYAFVYSECHICERVYSSRRPLL